MVSSGVAVVVIVFATLVTIVTMGGGLLELMSLNRDDGLK